MVMGDAHIRWNKPEMSISHGEKQMDYLQYKADLVAKATGKVVNVFPFPPYRGGNEAQGARFACTHRYFRVLRERCYHADRSPKFSKLQLDKLTPHALAIWYMDDGSLYPKKRNGKIHAYELVISCCAVLESDAQNIVDFFKEKYDLVFTIKRNQGLFSVRCGTREAKKFLSIVSSFIVPCLQYKVSM